jgi:type IV pilus assembly protein PilP
MVTIFIFLPITGVAADNPQAGTNAEGTEEAVVLNFEVIKGDYEYQIENRSDPFVPFYTGEAATADLNPNEIVESSTARLTGMQLFEPGQLNLVALMQHGGTYVAMVEDFKGQGYVIQEGTKIGRRGIVKQIIANKVLIEEVAVTRAGKELRSEIVMALRKEGEE